MPNSLSFCDKIREALGIVSGQKIQVIAYRNRIELIPFKFMRENNLNLLLRRPMSGTRPASFVPKPQTST